MSALILVPFFYKMKLTSINEYLERRFQSYWIRLLGSGIFITQNVLFSGVILYAPSIALKAFLGFPRWISILGVGLLACGINVGGIRAVVWTDLFQFIIMCVGVLAINWKGMLASGGYINAFSLAYERGRMNFFDFTVDPFMRHNFWNLLIGAGFHAFMQPGVHQLQMQRYSGMPSVRKAKQAILGSVPLKLTLVSLSLLTGFAIFGFYGNCDPLTSGKIQKIDDIVPYFVVKELMDIPGMMGIFTSCIFSATLSSLSSNLNSLAAVTWEDFLLRLKYFQTMTPKMQTNLTRAIGVTYGVIIIILAFFSENIGAIYVASSAVIFSCAGALYGIMVSAMFLPFVNAIGAMIGGLSGFILMITISFVSYLNKTKPVMLEMSTEGCSANEFIFHSSTTTPVPSVLPSSSNTEWPWKIFTLSYLLYAPVATLVAVVIACSVSGCIGICFPKYKRKPEESQVHPLARNIFKNYITQESKNSQNGGHCGDDEISSIGIQMKRIHFGD